jgi:ElaB/YqjD/DUF883 family membrane-anchored ribosome-binding protein
VGTGFAIRIRAIRKQVILRSENDRRNFQEIETFPCHAISVFRELLMSSTNGEMGMRDMADKATSERLEKEVAAVKNDISALTDQITDALNSFAGTAKKQARRGYKQARANVDTAVDDLSERGSAALDAAQDAALSIEETLEDVITQRPLATVGLALGLGFLIGATWRR